MKVRKAIIPAAGLGIRFLPATKAQPKEMLPVIDKPAIQYIVEEAVASGIEDIMIVTGRGKRAIEDHFDKSYELESELLKRGEENLLSIIQDISNLVDIHYIRQKEPRGLGHAIYRAKSFIGDEPFAVMLGDDIVDSDVPCLKQLLNIYDQYGSTVIGVQHVTENEVSKYGIVDCQCIGDRIYQIKNMVEKPEKNQAPSNIAILGRYIITPAIFKHIEDSEPGATGEIELTNALRTLALSEPMYAYDFVGKRYDLGNRLGFIKATVELALKREDLKEEFSMYLKSIVSDL